MSEAEDVVPNMYFSLEDLEFWVKSEHATLGWLKKTLLVEDREKAIEILEAEIVRRDNETCSQV